MSNIIFEAVYDWCNRELTAAYQGIDVTVGEKQFGKLFLAGIISLITMLVTGMIFGGMFAAFNLVIEKIRQLQGKSVHHTRYDDIGFWNFSIIIAIVLALFLIAGFAIDHFRNVTWRKLMPAFIWPDQSSPTPTVVARLGRVGHWTFVAAAFLAFAIGVYSVIENQTSISEAYNSRATWDTTHPYPGKPGYIQTSAPNSWGGVDYRPTIPDESYAGLGIGAICAVILLLIGRACRYVLSAE